MISIANVEDNADLASVKEMFLEYAKWLGFDLCFQGFDEELASLPGKYAPPRGRLLLARETDAVAGVVALRPFESSICEMKRLYVRPRFRGRRIGDALVDRVIAEAKLIGYRRMRLDTLPGQMTAASALYRVRGFVEIPPYYPNPLTGVAYLELDLR